MIDQEVKNQQTAITSLETSWDSIKQYLVINGTTNHTYADLKVAVCNGGNANIGGGKVEWKTTGEGGNAKKDEYATVTGVTITCSGN